MQLAVRQRKILIFLLGICLKNGGGEEFISHFGTETASKCKCRRRECRLLGAADWEVPEGRAARGRAVHTAPCSAGAALIPFPPPGQISLVVTQYLGERPAGAELQSGCWRTEAAQQLWVPLVSLQ